MNRGTKQIHEIISKLSTLPLPLVTQELILVYSGKSPGPFIRG